MRCLAVGFFPAYLLCVLGFAGCGDAKSDPNAGAPPPLRVESSQDPNVFQADRPDQFPLTTAVEHSAVSQLRVTGTVAPDISRTVPVVSLASGRVVEIAARLGDTVQKGQLLLRVQSSDIAGAFSDYQKAVADETLARSQGERAKDLFAKGAISQNDFQVAQDAAAKAEVEVKTATEKLQVLGSTDLNKPSGIVEVRAPISGVITDQQITNAAGIQGLSSPNPMTISDLTHVWILCDVFENDLAIVHVGEKADVRLNAYPDKNFSGVISNVGPILDPNLRTSKVRIELRNPGMMRVGMFVTATFHGQKRVTSAAVPATAVLHLHDRDWVYVPTKDKKFRRVEVKGGEMLPGGLQDIVSGIAPGERVVSNALELQNTVEQ
jgi:cobalt-zinc-cadmium efflux system membrane fusion protein